MALFVDANRKIAIDTDDVRYVQVGVFHEAMIHLKDGTKFVAPGTIASELIQFMKSKTPIPTVEEAVERLREEYSYLADQEAISGSDPVVQ